MKVVFDHEKLIAYQLARQLNRELRTIRQKLPAAAAEPADNLRRAGASIVRNIAEAGGKRTNRSKASYYYTARGSSMEVPASLDELVDCGFVDEARTQRARFLAWRITSLLVGLIRSLGAPIPPRPKTKRGGSKRGSRAATPAAAPRSPIRGLVNPNGGSAPAREREREREREP